MIRFLALNLCLLAVLVAVPGCRGGAESEALPEVPTNLSGTLTLFHSAGLSVPFRQISKLLLQQNPQLVIKAEPSGSRDAARKLTDLKRPCDVFASTDDQVTESLLMPFYAAFNLRFATDEMALAYSDTSRLCDEITPNIWYRLLLDDSVALGRADPYDDPVGFRTLLTLQLAEKYYNEPGLARKLKAKSEAFLRPWEADLFPLLSDSKIDYLFAYRSTCVLRGLNYLELPVEVNLGSLDLTPLYQSATVQVPGDEPGQQTTLIGAPLVCSVTLPRSSGNPHAAEAWIALLLSPQGREIMETSGFRVLTPARASKMDRVPLVLRSFCRPRD